MGLTCPPSRLCLLCVLLAVACAHGAFHSIHPNRHRRIVDAHFNWGYPLAAVASVVGHVSKTTVYRTIAYFKKTGLYWKPGRNRERRTAPDGFRHWPELRSLIQRDPALYLRELRAELRTMTGRLYNRSTIWKVLRRHGYSLKRLKYLAVQRSALERRRFRDAVRAHEDGGVRPCQWLWIDETHKVSHHPACAGSGRRTTATGGDATVGLPEG